MWDGGRESRIFCNARKMKKVLPHLVKGRFFKAENRLDKLVEKIL